MNKVYKISLVALVIFFMICLFVYAKYSDELVFAPEVFFTEILKFIPLTILWTILLGVFNKYNNESKKQKYINILLIRVLNKIQNTTYTKINYNQFSIDLNILNNNIETIMLIQELSPNEINQLNSYLRKMTSLQYKEFVNDVEFKAEQEKNYKKIDSYEQILNELKLIDDVFRIKK